MKTAEESYMMGYGIIMKETLHDRNRTAGKMVQ